MNRKELCTHRLDTTVQNLIRDRHVEREVPTCFQEPTVHLRLGPTPGQHHRYGMERVGDALVRWLRRHGFEGWDIARISRVAALPEGHAEITLIERLPQRRAQR